MDRDGDLTDLSPYAVPKPKSVHPSQQVGRMEEEEGSVRASTVPELMGGGRERRDG